MRETQDKSEVENSKGKKSWNSIKWKWDIKSQRNSINPLYYLRGGVVSQGMGRVRCFSCEYFMSKGCSLWQGKSEIMRISDNSEVSVY